MAESIEVTDYVSVAERTRVLGLPTPEGLAILPRHFATAETPEELQNESSAATVRQLWEVNGIEAVRLDPGEPFPEISEHFLDWVGPVIFIGGSLLSNEALVSVTLGVVSNYVYEMFSRLPGTRKVRLSVVVEEDAEGSCKKIDYKGDAAGIAEIVPAVEAVLKADD